MTIYSLDVLLFLFETSLLFHVQFYLLLPTCIQVSQEVGQVVCYSHLFQNFPQFIVLHTVKSFGIVNKAEIDVFLEILANAIVVNLLQYMYSKLTAMHLKGTQ